MKAKKRILAVLMCVIMGTLPVAVLANTVASENPADSVYLWGETLDSVDKYYHNGSNGAKGTIDTDSTNANAHYDPNTGELTLTNFDAKNVNESPDSNHNNTYSAIFADGDIEIVLNGDNFASTMTDSSYNANTVYIKESLLIRGSGSLTAVGGGEGTVSCGIIAENGNITVNEGSITGTGGASQESYGVLANYGYIILNSGSITGTGGDFDGKSYGITSGDIIAKGGKLTAIGGEVSDGEEYSSYGVNADSIDLKSEVNVIAKGHSRAIIRTPNLDGENIRASVNYDGSGLDIYDYHDIGTYKYFCKVGTPTGNSACSVYIGGEQLDSDNEYYHNGENGTRGYIDTNPTNANAHFDPNTGELVITNLDVQDVNTDQNEIDERCAIYACGNIVILLKGDSSVSTNANDYQNPTVYVEGDIIFTGNGALTASAKSKTGIGGITSRFSYGVFANNGDIIVNSGSVNGISREAGQFSCGVCAYNGDIIVNSGSITATGGKVDDETFGQSYGMYLSDGNIVVSSNGSITGTGGEASNRSCGVEAEYYLTVNGGSITGTGGNAIGNAIGNSYGVTANYGGITINSGSLKGTGGESDSTSLGVYGCITINSGSITGTGGKADSESCGVSGAYEKITVNNGSITGTGGKADSESCGVRGNAGITVISGSVMGIGGESVVLSYGVIVYDSINVYSGKITGTGDEAGKFSYGLYSSEKITVYSGSLTGTSGSITATEGGVSYGVYADEADLKSGISVLAKGHSSALNCAPDMNGNSANASVNFDGSELIPYVPANIDTYKYFCILSNETPASTATSEIATPTSAITAGPATPAATANATANATAAPAATQTPQIAVARVSKVKLNNLKGKSILVKWSTVKGAVKYKVWYATKKSFAKKLTQSCVVKTNKATLKKLKKGMRYYIRIKAVNKQGKMSAKYSSVKSVKVKK